MCTRHVVRLGDCAPAPVAAFMNCDALSAVEYLDDAASDTHLDLFMKQRVWNRVRHIVKFDMIVRGDASEPPLSVLIASCWQGLECRPFNTCKEIFATDAKAAH